MKKTLPLRKSAWQLGRPSIRLALTYLGIIMVLSISFSAIFYKVSTANLNLQLQTVTNTTGQPDGGQVNVVGVSGSNATVTSGTVSSVNEQLRTHLAAIRADLARRLVMLNIGALVCGGALSYVLARRTLRPIEEAMDLQSRFVSDASHELRTPLTIMQTEIEVVLKKPRLSLDRARAALESNYQEVTRLRELSEGLLQLAHLPQGEQVLAPFAIDEAVGDAINQFIRPAQAKSITIKDTVPKLMAEGEQQGLAQALGILLDNAIKYSPAGSAIYLEGKTEGKQLLLSVRDQGPGIRATDLPHIFERFYRADMSRSKHRVSGYGLGLAIAKQIVELQHGTIEVSSTLGKGSSFTIRLNTPTK